MTLIVVLDEVIEKIKAQPEREGTLYGRVLDDSEVTQILSCDNSTKYARVGRWVKDDFLENTALNEIRISSSRIPDKHPTQVILVLKPEAYGASLQGYLTRPNRSREIAEVRLFSVHDALNRVKGVVDLSFLARKRVLVVGLGSGGSRVALELAKSGVGMLRLVDHDRLDIDNITRHICGFSDMGRFKTRAVKDTILDHNPMTIVECYEIDVREEIDSFAKLVSDSDLVVAATGSPVINNITNELCVKAKAPAVFAGVWERASGGYVMRYIPEETPCFNCVHEFLLTMSPPNEGRMIDYSLIDDLSELKSEPGLSIDIGFIPLLQSKLSLLTLLKGTERLEDIPYHLVIWLNRSFGNYKSLTLLKANTKRRKDCVVCNPKDWERSKVGGFSCK